MKISEVQTTYPNISQPSKASFKGSDYGAKSGGNTVLLGTVAAASAAVAGVALYKNHKTGTALKEALNKLKDTENTVKITKDKLDETQKKLDEALSTATEDEKVKKTKNIKKKGKKILKKTKKFFKRQRKNIKSKFSDAGEYISEKIKTIKQNSQAKNERRLQSKNAQKQVDTSDIINEKWAIEQNKRREDSYIALQESEERLRQEKVRAEALRTKNKQEKITEKIENQNKKKIEKNNKKIENLQNNGNNNTEKVSLRQKIRNFFNSLLDDEDI